MSERTGAQEKSGADSRARSTDGSSEGDAAEENGSAPQSGQDQEKDRTSDEGEQAGPTMAQWAVGIGSTLLVLALLGFVLYLAVEGTSRPPVIQVRVERVLEAPGGYVVEVGVYNEGGSTAAALVIEGTLKQDTVTVERSSATISYVPADTEREAGLFFTRDPRRYELEVRPVGYDRP